MCRLKYAPGSAARRKRHILKRPQPRARAGPKRQQGTERHNLSVSG